MPARSGVILAIMGGSYSLDNPYSGYYELAYGTSSVSQGSACPANVVSQSIEISNDLGEPELSADSATAVISDLTISTNYYVYLCAKATAANIFTIYPSDLSLVEQ